MYILKSLFTNVTSLLRTYVPVPASTERRKQCRRANRRCTWRWRQQCWHCRNWTGGTKKQFWYGHFTTWPRYWDGNCWRVACSWGGCIFCFFRAVLGACHEYIYNTLVTLCAQTSLFIVTCIVLLQLWSQANDITENAAVAAAGLLHDDDIDNTTRQTVNTVAYSTSITASRIVVVLCTKYLICVGSLYTNANVK